MFRISVFQFRVTRALGLHLLSLVFALLALGCEKRKAEPLRLGLHKWPGYEFLFFGPDRGWIDRERVVLEESRNASETMEKIRKGEIDGGCLTLDEAIRLRASGVNVIVVQVLDISAGADAILVDPEIKGADEVKGKRIGLEKSALGEYILEMLLVQGKVQRGEVTLVECPPDQQVKGWEEKRFDVAISYEPHARKLEGLGMKRLTDSREMSGAIMDVMVVRSDRVAAKRSNLMHAIAGHFQGLRHCQVQSEDWFQRVAVRLRLSSQEAREVYAGIGVPSLAESRRLLEGKDPRAVQAIRQFEGVFRGAGRRPSADYQGFLDPRFLPVGEEGP